MLQQQGCLSGYGALQRHITKEHEIEPSPEVHKGNVYGSVVVEQPVPPALHPKSSSQYRSGSQWNKGKLLQPV